MKDTNKPAWVGFTASLLGWIMWGFGMIAHEVIFYVVWLVLLCVASTGGAMGLYRVKARPALEGGVVAWIAIATSLLPLAAMAGLGLLVESLFYFLKYYGNPLP